MFKKTLSWQDVYGTLCGSNKQMGQVCVSNHSGKPCNLQERTAGYQSNLDKRSLLRCLHQVWGRGVGRQKNAWHSLYNSNNKKTKISDEKAQLTMKIPEKIVVKNAKGFSQKSRRFYLLLLRKLKKKLVSLHNCSTVMKVNRM